MITYPEAEPALHLRLALCQINATVGDIAGNARRIADGIAAAGEAGAELVLFPELALTGYPPEDLLLKEHFLADARRELERAGRAERRVSPRSSASRSAPRTSTTPRRCSPGGAVHAIYRKVYLPNYGVFDEQRYFQAGPGGAVVALDGHSLGSASARTSGSPDRRPAKRRSPARR